jgi:4-amino-4-deoxy-L-arabinose transferase-like glycosyltransferase
VVKNYQRPVVEWIAPSWAGEWDRVDLYREHPAGILVLPSLVARMGYPAEQAAYVVNAVLQCLTVVATCRFAALFATPDHARAASWFLLLMPLSFTYRIRANHEQAIILLTLIGLYACERARARPRWIALAGVACCGALLIKGIFAVPVLLSCAVWLVLRRPAPDRRVAVCGGLILGALGVAATAIAYEWAYRAVTGEAFIEPYLRQQIGVAAASHGPFLQQKAANLGWYVARLVWYALPWSLAAIAALPGSVFRPNTQREHDAGRGLSWTVVVISLGWAALFALSDRRADRYIVPTYVLIGIAGALVTLRASFVGRVAKTVGRFRPVERAILWLALVAVSLAAWAEGLPRMYR